jgi:DNA-binding response OmpR family regulator
MRRCQMHILVVEDERRLAALMSRRLIEERHTADVIRDGITGLRLALATNAGYDLIVLDRMLPGLEFCRSIRAAGIAGPVLMVSAHQDVADCVAAFDAGADDYLAKPFALEELLARARAGTPQWAPRPRAPPRGAQRGVCRPAGGGPGSGNDAPGWGLGRVLAARRGAGQRPRRAERRAHEWKEWQQQRELSTQAGTHRRRLRRRQRADPLAGKEMEMES